MGTKVTELPQLLSSRRSPVIWGLMVLVGFLLLSIPAMAQAASEDSDRQDTAVAGAFHDQADHLEGRYSLFRTGERVHAVFSTKRSPVQTETGQRSEPLFFVPPEYRPSVSVINDIEGHYVLRDGSPDPADPALARIRLQVDPDGAVRYVGEAAAYGAAYLAFRLETMWGVTPAANFAVIQEILAATWANEGFFPLPAVPYAKPTPAPAPVVVAEEPTLTLKLESATVPSTARASAPHGEARRLPKDAAAALLGTVPQLSGPRRRQRTQVARRQTGPATRRWIGCAGISAKARSGTQSVRHKTPGSGPFHPLGSRGLGASHSHCLLQAHGAIVQSCCFGRTHP